MRAQPRAGERGRRAARARVPGDDGEGGQDDFVALAEADRIDGNVDRGGAVGDGGASEVAKVARCIGWHAAERRLVHKELDAGFTVELVGEVLSYARVR